MIGRYLKKVRWGNIILRQNQGSHLNSNWVIIDSEPKDSIIYNSHSISNIKSPTNGRNHKCILLIITLIMRKKSFERFNFDIVHHELLIYYGLDSQLRGMKSSWIVAMIML